MLWTEIRKWAKDRGYTTIKDKDDGKYYWSKLDDNNPDASGVAPSVSKLATAIFNHISSNKWIDHQIEYKTKLEEKKFSISDYGT